MKVDARCRGIQLILSDVDGVLTDGGVSFDNQGIEIKQFHIRDGLGIKLWHRAGFRFGLLTSRNSHLVKVRAAELGVDLVRQGVQDKRVAAERIVDEFQYKFEQVCFIGDDLPDLPLLQVVGLGVAVADAVDEVRGIAHWTSRLPGGRGAVRETIEMILRAKELWGDVLQQFT